MNHIILYAVKFHTLVSRNILKPEESQDGVISRLASFRINLTFKKKIIIFVYDLLRLFKKVGFLNPGIGDLLVDELQVS